MSTSTAHLSPQRQTGRTSRQLTMAICGMLMGRRVVFVSHDGKTSARHRQWCEEWLQDNGWYDQKIAPVRSAGDTLSFGSGSLTFRSMTSSLAGLRFDLTIEDHRAEEVRQEQERRAQFLADQATILHLMRKHGLFVVRLGQEVRR